MKKLYTALVLTLFVLPLFAQNIPSYVPKEGLVGYWPFNGNANDESGNGNHGTVNGATLTADRNGVTNSAYSFDGDNDFITISNSLIKGGFQSYTISYWFNKLAPTSSTQAVINDRNSMISGYKYYSNFVDYINGSGVQACSANQDITSTSCVSSKSNNQSNGNWNNVIITLNAQTKIAKIYLNGVEEGSNLFNPTSWPISTNSTYLGGSPLAYGDEQWLDGKLDDVTFYNRALSEQEITALYTGNPIAQNIPSYVPKEGLVGYWPFNGNANDESGNGNHGTVNGATLTADRNGVANSAYSFDGISNLITTNYLGIGGSDPRTISFWMKTNFNSIMHPLTYGGGSNDAGVAFQCTFNYGAQGVNSNTGYSAITYSTPSEINNGTWNLYTWVVQNSINATTSNILIYQNGNLLNIKTYLFNENTPVKTLLGIALQFGGDFGKYNMFKGQLDDITIYNRALSEQEIAQLYAGCTKETATSSSFNALMYTTNAPVNLTASPTGGTFSGNGVTNDTFNPAKAKLGKNTVKYNFKNSTGCADSTDFAMLVVDTVGATCTKYDTVIFNKTKYDTITVKNNIYDTVTIKNNVFDTVKVTKFDTVTVTNNVTKYDTVKVTKFDTITIKNNVYDTVTITNNVTKYDTITITNNVTKYDTVIVNKTNYDTVSILKIKFKLTTGIHANQLSSLSIYPNPTSDVLHIEVSDVKDLEGYRYRILDALGKEVYNQLVTQTTTEIPLKTLGAAGMYQFEILDAKNTSIQSNKIVLQ